MASIGIPNGIPMPKSLSDIQVKNIKQHGNYRVAPSLYLYVEKKATGEKKQWKLRKQVDGKRRWIYIGSYPAMSPTEAKQKAIELLTAKVAPQEILRKAKDEKVASAKKETEKRKTFAVVTEEYLDAKKRMIWAKNSRSEQSWFNTLNKYIYPVIAQKQIEEITPSDLVKILRPIWVEKNVTATNARSRVENIIDFAISLEYSDKRNPAKFKGLLENLLPTVKKKRKHHPALPYVDTARYTRDLYEKSAMHSNNQARDNWQATALGALKLILGTQARSADARNALWTHFNFEESYWMCPIGKAGGEEHKLPIPKNLLLSLKQRAKFATDERVFPGDNGHKFLSSNFLVRELRSFGYHDKKGKKITLHGFRATFTSWTAATGSGLKEDSQMQLGHKENDETYEAYMRDDLFDRRTALMQRYEDYAFSDMASSIH